MKTKYLFIISLIGFSSAVNANEANIEESQRYKSMGETCLKYRAYEAAKTNLVMAAQYDPTNAKLWGMAGYAARSNGDLTEAAEYFQKSTELDPLNHNAFGNLGLINLKLRKYEDAAEAYKKALALNPQGYVAAGALAECYYELRDYETCMYYVDVFEVILDDIDLRFASERTKRQIEPLMTKLRKYKTVYKVMQEEQKKKTEPAGRPYRENAR